MDEIKYNIPTSPNFAEVVSKKYYRNLKDTVDTWYPWPIYLTYAPSAPGKLPSGGNGDWYIFRLAETYLLRAEAYYWKDELALAAGDINKVRERARAPLIISSDVSIDYIFNERARELYMEEPRHSELVRVSYIMAKLNMNGYSLKSFSAKNYYYDRVMQYNTFYSPPILSAYSNTARIAPFHVLWAIPQSVILANTLGQINQNVGYAGADKNVPAITTPIQ
jgi:starch-binding outer membrane protein, SusD/RagB family